MEKDTKYEGIALQEDQYVPDHSTSNSNNDSSYHKLKELPHTHFQNNQEKEEFSNLLDNKVKLTSDVINNLIGPESDTRICIRWLQPLAHPITYLAAMSYLSLTSGLIFYYYTGSITTVERRYGLSSKITGVISTGNDIISILFSIPLGYVSGRGHRPRWVVVGVIIGVISCFLLVLPHFIYGAGEYGEENFFSTTSNDVNAEDSSEGSFCHEVLTNTTVSNTCSKVDKGGTTPEQKTVIILQFIGQMLLGVCNIQLYVTGYSYLDDAVSKEDFPLYLGTAGMLRVFGPVVAMMISSWSLNKWIDPSITPNITPKHPNWVGAWWLGYLVIGATLFTSMFPMLMMPKMLPGTRKRLITRLVSAADEGKEKFEKVAKGLRPRNKINIKDLTASLKSLLKNSIFNIICLNQFVFWMGIVIFFMFSNKYMEHQFQLSAAEASKYAGIVGMFATFFGWLLGGSIMTFGKPKPRNVIIITVGISATLISQYLGLMTFTCKQPDILGLDMTLAKLNKNADFGDVSPSNAITSCMSSCNCDVTYSPVCVTVQMNKSISHDIIDEDDQSHHRKVSFFSPCHAGCTTHVSTNHSDVNMFGDCKCASTVLEPGEKIMSVEAGECPRRCSSFYPFLMLKSSIGVFLSANRIIANSIFFRCMNERDKDLGLSIMNVLVCLGLIIGPILCGQAIDWTCKLWEMSCGVQQSCKLYNIDAFRYILHISPAASIGIGMILELMLFFHIDKIELYDDSEKSIVDVLKNVKSRILAKKSRKI